MRSVLPIYGSNGKSANKSCIRKKIFETTFNKTTFAVLRKYK